jgi:hypothetical protein
VTRLSNQPQRDIVGELRAEIARLEAIVEHRAQGYPRKHWGDLATSTSRAPSRLMRNATARRQHDAIIAMGRATEMEKRLPQITWLKRKLRRIEEPQS